MSPKRRIYFYAMSLISSVVLLAGASMVIRRLILGWAAGDSPAGALLNGSGLWWLLLAALALAAWLAHWIPANRAARLLTMAAAAERGAWPRKAYFYLGQSVLLAAAAAQIVLALRAALLWLLGGADAPADAATAGALAGGGFAALAAWAYLRWENARDGDLGHESGRIVTLRRFYVYSFALVGLALAFGGAGETLRSLASLLARPLDASTLWREPLATAFAALSVGLPLTLGAWGTAGRAAKAAPAAETNALSRVVLRYSVLFGGTAVTLLSAGYLIEQVALLILRQPRSALPSLPLMGSLDWTHAVAYLPAAVIAWATYADGIREDAALGGEVPRTATARRLVRYAIAAAVLAAFWFGLTEFARLIIQVILGSPEGGLAPAAAPAAALQMSGWSRFARAAALVLVAAPAWWGHWWSQQVRARTAGPSGQAERASTIRRIYLWAVVGAGAVLTVAALGFSAFLALNWSATSASGSLRAAVAGAIATAAVALFWTVTHALVLRGDMRWLATAAALVAASQATMQPAPDPASEPAPDPAAVMSGPGPRRYRREDLEALAASRGIVVPMRPLAVIDGGDGAMGAALVAALHQARPNLQLWPIGLNAAAQVAMLNALGEGAATMPMAPAVPADALSRVAAVLGPADILTPGGLDGEVTAELVAAVAGSPGRVLLLPARDPHLRWVAAPEWPLARWVENAVIEAIALAG